MQIYYDFAGSEKNIPKIEKLQQKKPLGNFVTILLRKIYFMTKVVFFQKNQFGINVWCGKPWEIGQNWI